jgi:hypothetical protein
MRLRCGSWRTTPHGAGLFEAGVRVDEDGGKWRGLSETLFER